MPTVCGGGELTTGSETVRHETLEEDGVEVGTTEIDGSGVSCRTRADDDLHESLCECLWLHMVQGITNHFRVHLLALGISFFYNGGGHVVSEGVVVDYVC